MKENSRIKKKLRFEFIKFIKSYFVFLFFVVAVVIFLCYTAKISDLKDYFNIYIYPILLTWFFARLILYSNILLYIEKRSYEINKKEYDLMIIKLEEISKLIFIMDSLWYMHLKNKLEKKYLLVFNEINSESIEKFNSNILLYFPEFYALSKDLFYSFDLRREKLVNKNFWGEIPDYLVFNEKLINLLSQLILIKKQILVNKLNWEYKNKIEENENYYDKVSNLIEKDEYYKYYWWKELSWFDYFKDNLEGWRY